MKTSRYFKLGLFILIGAGLIGAAVIVLGAGRLLEKQIAVETLFDESVDGLEVGSPVKYRGVQIGRVTSLELLQPTGVRVTAQIDRNRTILDCDACWITSASVLGDSVLEFVPPDRVPAGAKQIEGGTEIINGRVASNPLEAVTNIEPALQVAMASVRDAGNEVATTARSPFCVISLSVS